MTALNTDDLAVVTGPLRIDPGSDPHSVYLTPGEVVRVTQTDYCPEFPEYDSVLAFGFESKRPQWIDPSSLTPLSEIQNAPDVEWGDLSDPDYVHDYVTPEVADV